MSFSAKICNVHLKSFCACLQFLLKIGKELIVEIANDILTFRTLNDSKSVFAAIEFCTNNFFETFECTTDASMNGIFACKLPIKVVIFYS